MRHLQDPGKILAQVTRPQVREPRHVDRVPGFSFAWTSAPGPWIDPPGPAPRSPDRVPQPRRVGRSPAAAARLSAAADHLRGALPGIDRIGG